MRDALRRAGESTLVNFLCGLDQFFQTDKSFPRSLDSTRRQDEAEAKFHNVVRTAVTRNKPLRLASLHNLALPAANQFVKGALECAFIDFLAWMGLLNRLERSHGRDASMALAEFPDRLRQIETCGPLRHVHFAFLR
jgi:hypothetical protein